MKIKKDHRGLTLIEVICAIAIISIFAGVVATYVLSTSNFYRGSYHNAKVQMETQELLDELQNMVIDANRSIYYAKGSGTKESMQLSDAITSDMGQPVEENKTLIVCNVKESGASINRGAVVRGASAKEYIYDIVDWDKDSQSLYYIQKKNISLQAANSEEEEWSKRSLLSENVTSFAVDVSKVKSDRKVEFQITMRVKGKEITTNHTVTLRNQILVLRPGDTTGDDERTYSPSIQIVNTETLKPGEIRRLKARYKDIDITTIRWRIADKDREKGSIDQDGILTVSENAQGSITVIVSALGLDGNWVEDTKEIQIEDGDDGGGDEDEGDPTGPGSIVTSVQTGDAIVFPNQTYTCNIRYNQMGIYAITDGIDPSKYEGGHDMLITIKWTVVSENPNTYFDVYGRREESAEGTSWSDVSLKVAEDEKGFLLKAHMTVEIVNSWYQTIATEEYDGSTFFSVVQGVKIVDPDHLVNGKMIVGVPYTVGAEVVVSKPVQSGNGFKYETYTMPYSPSTASWNGKSFPYTPQWESEQGEYFEVRIWGVDGVLNRGTYFSDGKYYSIIRGN